jgi:Putative MetA-pathway of phenol degradation
MVTLDLNLNLQQGDTFVLKKTIPNFQRDRETTQLLPLVGIREGFGLRLCRRGAQLVSSRLSSIVGDRLDVLVLNAGICKAPRIISARCFLLGRARSTCALFLAVGVGTLAPQARAQTCGANAQSPIATDRPQITSSSIVVPCGSLQFENGFQETSNGGQETFDFPETAVRLGIASKTELRLGVPDYFYNSYAPAAFGSGFSDLSLGFKQQLGPTRGGFDVSLIASVSFPTGANLISSHGYDPTVQLPWSRSLTKNWTVAGMFSVMWPTEGPRRNLTGQSSVYFDRQLTKLWDIYVEYSGSFPQRGGPQNVIDFGTAYKITPHQQLDFHYNFGLSAATPDHSIGFGYSVRFQLFRSR